MDKINVSLSVDELDCLIRLVKERIAVWGVRLETSSDAVVEEHCRFEMSLYNSLLKSLIKSV